MSIYVIGDLHLSLGTNKPMSIFGDNWEGHSKKIEQDWLAKVKSEDTVILAGDFSWAMNLEETYKDFEFINNLPGKKILLKGNHDYWWTTVTNMKNYLKENGFENIDFLYNNSFEIENKIITGTRGWSLMESENSKKMLNRESLRLELSIKSGLEIIKNDNEIEQKIKSKQENKNKLDDKNKEIITIMHYPPISRNRMKNTYTYNSEFLEIMKKYNIKRCYYGHLHGKSHEDAVEGNIEGIEFKLISSDYLNFCLEKIDK